MKSDIEGIKRKLWSRMRNYTSDKILLKRYMNDLNLIEKETLANVKELIEKKMWKDNETSETRQIANAYARQIGNEGFVEMHNNDLKEILEELK